MKDNQRKTVQEKAHRIRVGSSNILNNYLLAGTIQLIKLANCDDSISRASDVTGGE